MESNGILFTESHRKNPFSHQMPGGQILSITTEKKTQIIALSILVGIFTLGIGGALLFYSLAAKYKVEQIKKFKSEAARETNLSSISAESLSNICACLSTSDLNSLGRVNKEIGAIANKKLIQLAGKRTNLSGKKTNLSSISAKSLSHICAYLSASDLSSLSRVDQQTRAIANKKLIMREVNQLGWNLGWNEGNLEIQSANKYLTELFTAVKLLGKTYTLPIKVCVYHENSYRVPFFSKQEVNARRTVHNLHFLTEAQLNTLLLAASKRGDIGIVKLLLHQGADINAADARGERPLHYAVLHERVSVVKYLLEQGANPNQANNIGETPLYRTTHKDNRAAYKDHCLIAKLLLDNGAKIDVTDELGKTPLHWAARGGGCWGYQHVYNGHFAMVKLLLSKGADVNAADGEGNRPLHIAATHERLGFVEYLLERRADPNQANAIGEKPLHRAACKGGFKVVELLVSQGVDVNAADGEGDRPLHIAARKGRISAVKYLLEQGANPNQKNASGKTPLYRTTYDDEYVVRNIDKSLLDHGAKVDVADNLGKTPLHWAVLGGSRESFTYLYNSYFPRIKLLLSKGADVNAADGEGNSPLHIAAKESRLGMVKCLLKQGADPNQKNVSGETPLHSAAYKGLDENIRLLLSKGADINAVNNEGNSPLHIAVRRFDKRRSCGENIKLLLRKGADINLVNKKGQIPLDMVSRINRKRFTKLFY